jgi:hypothetical protein
MPPSAGGTPGRDDVIARQSPSATRWCWSSGAPPRSATRRPGRHRDDAACTRGISDDHRRRALRSLYRK